MSSRGDDTLVHHFDRLVDLPPAQRAAALDALDLDTAQRSALALLLAADTTADERLDRALRSAALRLHDLHTLSAMGGTRLGAWRVVRELGAGGMGTVFLAQRADDSVRQQVAIKLLRGFPTEDGRRRLRQERQVLAQLDHPHIAHLIDVGETDDGQPYFVMEYVEGEIVTAHAARRNLDARARVELLDRIAEAVAHAHQRLVIHRDLKPSNVMVRGDGTPKLLDFGVAKLVDINEGVGVTSTRVWTPGYASPEQKAGQPVTTATDVFALGTLARELLSGRRPSGETCEPALAAVVIDGDLNAILDKATAEAAGERYATVDALRDDLALWRDGRPVRAARNTALYRARKFVRRHRGSVSLVLLVLISLAVFVWRLGVERDRALAAEALAEQRRVAAEQAAEAARGSLEFFGGVLTEVASEDDIDAPITLRSVLERGLERIPRELPKDSPTIPLVSAYLGDLYTQLGDAARAEPLLAAGLSAMEQQGLDRGIPYGLTARRYALVLVEIGRLPESIEWLRKSAAALRHRGAGPLERAEAALSDVVLATYEDRHADAESLAEAAVADAIAAGVGAEAVASLQSHQVSALNSQSKSAQAEALVEQALSRLAAHGLERSLYVYQFEQDRGIAQAAQGRFAEAIASYDRARDVWLRARGESGFLLIILDEWRTVALQGLGRLGEARAVIEASMARFQRATGRPPDAVSRYNLAWALSEEGELQRAAALARDLVAESTAMTDLTAFQRYGILAGAGRLIARAGAYAEGRSVLERQIEESSAALGAQHRLVAAHQLLLAEVALQSADLPTARRAVDAAGSVQEAGPTYADGLQRVRGRLALAEGHLDVAARDLEALAERSDPKRPLAYAIVQLDLAALRAAQGKADEARALVQQYLPVMRASVRPAEPARERAEDLAGRLEVMLNDVR